VAQFSLGPHGQESLSAIRASERMLNTFDINARQVSDGPPQKAHFEVWDRGTR